ncbi:helix-turn-helix domain-containing protein [bacterium]|nr:helix-turn-helix domain-containing protein [bacterium]
MPRIATVEPRGAPAVPLIQLTLTGDRLVLAYDVALDEILASRGGERTARSVVLHGDFRDLAGRLVDSVLEAATPRPERTSRVDVDLPDLIARALGTARAARAHAHRDVAAAIAAVERHFHRADAVDRAVRATFLSRSRFDHVFSEVTGSPFGRFLREVRLHASAALLLKEPYLPMGHVAARTGPWGLCTFQRNFKKLFGCPPSDYRQQGMTNGR